MISDLKYESLIKTETALMNIVKETSHKSGHEYLNVFVKILLSTIKAGYVFVGIPENGKQNKIKTIALCDKTGIINDFSYSLKDTPCENVYGKKICSYKANVTNLFPKDQLLIDMKIESYIGTPLYTEKSKSIGIIVCLFHEELKEIQLIETILKIFGNRVATEIERLNVIEILQKTNIEYYKLYQRYKAQNKELTKSKNKAEESDRLKTKFINNISHEIRTPMNSILGFSNFLKKKNLSDEKREQFIDKIQVNGNRLLQTIDDIMEISKLETKQVKVTEKEVCLNKLLSEIQLCFESKANENETPLSLHTSLSDVKSVIKTDSYKIKKIVIKLLENAIKFTKTGFIEFGYRQKDNELEIYVKDTGIGIDTNKQETIFKPFIQEEKELSEKSGGVGLGLPIAKENAKLLGGNLSLKSEKGNGATFILTIPYKRVISDLSNITVR